MQQILDRTEQALAQAFEALAQNARRQRNLYYATIGLLIAIVLVSATLLAGLAAARHLDDRRSLVGQHVAAISLMLQGEVSFLRRTDLTVRYNRETPARQPADAEIVRQVQQTGIGEALDPGYAVLVPPATRAAWGSALPERLAQLQQIATAAITTQQAFELDHRAYIVDVQAEYAIVIARDHPSHGHSTLLAATLATDIRDRLGEALRARIGQPVPRRNEQVWLGPSIDPVLGTPVMTVVSAVYSGAFATTLIAAVIPVEEFLARLQRTSRMQDRATLLLLNSAEQPIDALPAMSQAELDRIVTRVRRAPREKFEITRAGVLLVQPLRAGFGAFVYFVPAGALIASLASDLSLIGALALLLSAAILITARYWDIHLLRRSHVEATRALENETINHVLVSTTPIGLCIVRLHDDAVVKSNQLADTLLRLGEPPRLPRHIVSAFPPGPLNIKVGRLAATAQFIVPAEPELPPEDRRFLQITYAPVRYREEDVLFCAIQDVTAQQQLEERLRAAQRTAESMMRARSNFFAAMSHEIRTPLNALLGNLELLARAPGLDAHASRLRALDVAASGLRRIVNDILDFSKIDAGEMKLVIEPFHPIEDLESLALSYCPMIADRPVRFYPLISPSLDTTIVGDRTRIMQVVNNLLSNAFKFTSSGKVTLSARLTTDAKDRTVLVCQVKDSGIGMPPTLVARIFHPFVQAEPNTASRYGGTGLGLSICARLCELMGGHIAVESVEGVGSAFSVHVPVGLREGDAVAKAPPPSRGTSALIVSQESETGGYAEAWLQARGWRTHAVQSMAAAERFLDVNRPHVMLVSGDYDLPVVCALRAYLAQRSEGHAAHIVWVTRDGPPHATPRASGIVEVGSFHHRGVIAAVETEVETGARTAGETAMESAVETHATTETTGTAATAAPLPALAAAGVATTVPDAVRSLRVLVAEDNLLNQTLIAEQLAVLGCRPTVVGDGRQAVEALERGDFDIVLTDIHMPVMDGYALLAALQVTHPALPVLAFSALTHAAGDAPRGASADDGKDWRQRGFAGHIAKPASLGDIEATLRRVAPRPATPDVPAAALSAKPIAYYDALLRTQLDTDLPQLASCRERRDTEALFHWAHRAAGAFRIVEQRAIVAMCREVERQCRETDVWTAEIDKRAQALHAAVRAYHQRGAPAAAAGETPESGPGGQADK